MGRMRNSQLQWTSAPDLLLIRWGHRSIAVGNNIFHIGGAGEMLVLILQIQIFIVYFRQTEKWVLKGDEIYRELLTLTLKDYSNYPELFNVSYDYCKQLL